jgi:hypothetical protein
VCINETVRGTNYVLQCITPGTYAFLGAAAALG